MGIVIGTILGIAITVETALAAASALFSIVMTLTAKKPQMPSMARGQAERKQTLRSSTAPSDWVYGHTVKAGVLTFAEEEAGGWQDDTPDPEQNQGYVEWLHMVLTMCDHPIERIDRIWLNDDLIETFGGNASYDLWNNRTTADQFMLQNCPSWKADMIGRGLTALRMSLLFSQKKFPSGIPNVKAEIFGRRIYDPRDRITKWSDNAALVYLDFIRNHPKIKVPDERIDWESFKRAANICDEIVTRPDGKPEKRYTINGAFDLSERPSAIMDDMLAAMSGERTEFGGLHGVMAGAYYGGAPIVVTGGMIISGVDITPESARRDRVNTITGTFVDPQQLYVETDYPQVRVSEWVQQDGEELKDDLKLRFVTSDYQAQRLANIQMRRKRLGQTIAFKMNASGYGIRQGMYIQLKLPEMGIDTELRVIDWSLDPSDMSVAITTRQDGIAVWDDAVGKPMERPPLTNLPSGIPAPSNIQYRTEVIGEVVQGVLTWLNTAQVAYTNIIIKRGGVMIYTAQEMRPIHRVQGLPVGDYSAELIAVGMNGGQSAVSTIAFSIQLPPAVIGCDIRAGNWEIGLTPKLATSGGYGTQFEFFYYRTKLPIGEVIAKAQKLGSGTQLTHNGLQPDTIHYYWIRAINAYGQGPLFAVEAKTTKDVNSVLDIISGQIGAEDLIEELRKPLTETIDMWTAKVGNTDIGKYGGIGLTIEQDPDGVWRTKCIVDAQVFAILDPSGATGAGSRHPFVVKDGVVYMNKLLLDDAEIGSVIAKYINVKHLVGVLIEAGTIKSSDNGQSFQLLPDGTLTARKANITGAITATSGSFAGTVNANAGTMNNITIAENCNVLGTIYANRLVGDVARTFIMPYKLGQQSGSTATASSSVTVPRSDMAQRGTLILSVSLLGITSTEPRIEVTIYQNGSIIKSAVVISRWATVAITFDIQANAQADITATVKAVQLGSIEIMESPVIVQRR
ncbi:putative tail protein [Plesiomonas phage phiP4-7]|nr:putative tail protein [Plesiomonas phage phiP4-7]